MLISRYTTLKVFVSFAMKKNYIKHLSYNKNVLSLILIILQNVTTKIPHLSLIYRFMKLIFKYLYIDLGCEMKMLLIFFLSSIDKNYHGYYLVFVKNSEYAPIELSSGILMIQLIRLTLY